MALKDNERFLLPSLGLLYLVQGIPYGMQDKFIPMQLKSNGLDYSSISFIKCLLIPWVTKGLWAPFIEICGTDLYWLMGSVMLLALASFAGSVCEVSNLLSLGLVLAFLNIGCAVQDIVVDGLAIRQLKTEQFGLLNSIQLVLYKVGALVGGGGMLYLITQTSWRVCFLTVAAIYVVTASSVYFSGVCGGQRKKSSQIAEVQKDSVLNIFKGISSSNSNNLWLCSYVFVYKMGERGCLNNFPLFLLDSNVSMNELIFWNGTLCPILSILGSLYGGYIYSHTSSITGLLTNYSLKSILPMLSFCLCTWYPSSLTLRLGILSLCYLSYTGGVMSALTFTLMMVQCKALPQTLQASQYSVYASIEVAGKLAFGSCAGFIVDTAGVFMSFMIFTTLAVLPLCVLKQLGKTLSGKQHKIS